ncbi:hypothetical protein ACRARG_17555 [Pseudooceanicola sp. C21-150M6]|uniref:hypothetical protein n=1 Tax=Pseudooceanicola sp. C21-150M6 TaxID=3434355 RepID=UPI003D7FC4C9
MKKSLIAIAAVPVLCAGAGFGAGKFLVTKPAATHEEAAVSKTDAEEVLDQMADEHDTHAAPQTEDHGAAGHEAEAPAAHGTEKTPAAAHGDSHAEAIPASYQWESGSLPNSVSKPTRVAEAMAALEARKKAEQAKWPRNPTDGERLRMEGQHISQTRTEHPALLPVNTEAKVARDAIKRIEESDDHVVKLGRMTVPVYKAANVTYVVADFGVSVSDLDQAKTFYEAENATRLRDVIMKSMHDAAGTTLLQSDVINAQKLADRVADDLKQKFRGVEDVLFLSLYQTDLPRS